MLVLVPRGVRDCELGLSRKQCASWGHMFNSPSFVVGQNLGTGIPIEIEMPNFPKIKGFAVVTLFMKQLILKIQVS